jgi:hypothetical protein
MSVLSAEQQSALDQVKLPDNWGKGNPPMNPEPFPWNNSYTNPAFLSSGNNIFGKSGQLYGSGHNPLGGSGPLVGQLPLHESHNMFNGARTQSVNPNAVGVKQFGAGLIENTINYTKPMNPPVRLQPKRPILAGRGKRGRHMKGKGKLRDIGNFVKRAVSFNLKDPKDRKALGHAGLIAGASTLAPYALYKTVTNLPAIGKAIFGN